MPLKIIYIHENNFVVDWNKRKDGTQPLYSLISMDNEDFRMKYKELIIDFYFSNVESCVSTSN